MTINCRCPLCGTVTQVTCKEDAWLAYTNGALAQDVFHDMDIHARETIISGMCDLCQIAFFEADEDDECDGECDICMDFDCPSNASIFAPREE